MQGPAACLFDLDGVIIDTARYHYRAWRELADMLGFVFTEQHNERLKGVSRMRSLEILLEIGGLHLDAKQMQALAEKKNKRYLELVMQMKPDEILPGALEFLSACRTAGMKVALCSASKNAPAILQHMNITHHFDAVIDGNLVRQTKPDPEVFLLGALALSVAPQDCVVFEDAEAGICAGRRAGMFCVGIGDKAILHEANVVVGGLQHMTIAQLRTVYAGQNTITSH